MIIRTAQEQNAANCCGCDVEECAEPSKECQSVMASATSADDDHTDAVAAWVAAGSVGDTPAPPAGYGDVEHGSWLPFIEPGEAPTLYRTLETGDEETVATGTVKRWSAWSGEEPDSFAYASWTTGDGQTVSFSEWVYNYGVDVGPYGGYTVVPLNDPQPVVSIYIGFPVITDPSFAWTDLGAGVQCAATTRETWSEKREATAGGSATDLHAIADSLNDSSGTGADITGWPPATDWEWTILTEKTGYTETLGDGVTLADVRDRAAAKIPTEWPAPATGGSCASIYAETWPTPADYPAPWPDCDDISLPVSDIGGVNLTKARYRFGVPESYSTVEAPRSVWEMQWDEVFFPDGYDAEIDDPAVTPPDPLPGGWAHPQIPDPAAPAPTLVAAKSWTWGGSMETPWSDWFEIPVPTEPGETRPVNVMVKCYHSTRLGVKPTSSGETCGLPEV